MFGDDFWESAARYKYAILLAAFLSGVGWILTTHFIIHWLDAQIPITILVFWYAFVMAPLIFIFGRAHKGEEGFGHRQTFAFMMVFIAFSLASSPSSQYTSLVTGKDASTILESSEAGVTYDFFTRLGADPESARLITYVIMPAVLVLAAAVIYKPEYIQKAIQRN